MKHLKLNYGFGAAKDPRLVYAGAEAPKAAAEAAEQAEAPQVDIQAEEARLKKLSETPFNEMKEGELQEYFQLKKNKEARRLAELEQKTVPEMSVAEAAERYDLRGRQRESDVKLAREEEIRAELGDLDMTAAATPGGAHAEEPYAIRTTEAGAAGAGEPEVETRYGDLGAEGDTEAHRDFILGKPDMDREPTEK